MLLLYLSLAHIHSRICLCIWDANATPSRTHAYIANAKKDEINEKWRSFLRSFPVVFGNAYLIWWWWWWWSHFDNFNCRHCVLYISEWVGSKSSQFPHSPAMRRETNFKMLCFSMGIDGDAMHHSRIHIVNSRVYRSNGSVVRRFGLVRLIFTRMP